jgi:hypothetical protein
MKSLAQLLPNNLFRTTGILLLLLLTRITSHYLTHMRNVQAYSSYLLGGRVEQALLIQDRTPYVAIHSTQSHLTPHSHTPYTQNQSHKKTEKEKREDKL